MEAIIRRDKGRGILIRGTGFLRVGLAIAIGIAVSYSGRAQLVPYVQPLCGTAPSTTPAALKHSEAGSEKNANTIPAVGLPFRMTQWTPQTRTTEIKCIPPYFFRDTVISGFRATHWLSGSCTQDYGSLTILPVTGRLVTRPGRTHPLRHEEETTTPAYYRLHLREAGVTTEITATARCGIMRFTMLRDDSLYLLITPNSDYGDGLTEKVTSSQSWSSNPARRIYQGWGKPAGFSGFYFLETGRPAVSDGSFHLPGVMSNFFRGSKQNVCRYVGFYLKKDEQVTLRIGSSFTSVANAKKNLYSEINTREFDEVHRAASSAWEEALGRIAVDGSEKNKRIFYTALYHSMQQPRLFTDVDGSYPKFSGNYETLASPKGNYYDDFSMWDIYRAQLPLYELLRPSLVNDFVRSVVAKGTQGGWLPIFPCWNNYTSAMIGDHAAVVIAAAFNKGIRDFDVEEAYRLMRKNAFDAAGAEDYLNGKGRRALTSYLRYGYIPVEDSVPIAFHKKEQVSRTLEYAYDDYAIATMAKALEKTNDYPVLAKRAFNFTNVFDPGQRLVRSRYINSGWYSPFLPDNREPYITEGTPRQYTFYVPHAVDTLAALMGGAKALEKALDTLFLKGEYWHGNEPGHQVPFLYNYTPSPWKTQKKVHEILSEEYTDGPGGLSGNDDAGQMSAWYIFSSMGFYPVDPVSGNYLISTPLFDRILLRLENGKSFEMTCKRKSPGDSYIRSVKLNGEHYGLNFIRYADIMAGGKMEFVLQANPGRWGSRPSHRAGSFSLK